MRRLSADYIFFDGNFQGGLMLVISKEGQIISVEALPDLPLPSIEIFSGSLIPGFINAHCHLELSHLKGLISKGTGLGSFGMQVVAQRENANRNFRETAAEFALSEMRENGIVAVGDISNQSWTAELKSKPGMYWHTFVELIAFNPGRATQVLQKGIEVLSHFKKTNHSKAGLAAHATYSVSQELMDGIAAFESGNTRLSTIHLLESADETEFFKSGTGKIAELYASLGLDTSFFHPGKYSPADWISPLLHSANKNLFIHNTQMDENSLLQILENSPDSFFCFCPAANLYIENQLPEINMFRKHNCKITLGTDSLASNDSLSILGEIKILAKHFPDISHQEFFRWATENGADVLGFKEILGSFSPGKTPGINLLKNYDPKNAESLQNSQVQVVMGV